MKLPKELIEAVKSDNLVLFTGAGLSYTFRNKEEKMVGGWKELIKQIIDSFPEDKYLTTVLVHSALSRGDKPIQILDIIEVLELLPKEERAGYVKYFYFIDDSERYWLRENLSKQIITKKEVLECLKQFYSLSTSNCWDLHEDLCRLSNIIITTNYDNAFEQVQRPVRTVILGNNPETRELHKSQEITLIKLHGSIFEPDTMVIFPVDYARLYEHRSHRMVADVRKLILSKSMLFMGCGMGDWQINNIFLKAKTLLADLHQRHFIIVKRDEFEENRERWRKHKLDDFLTPVIIDNFSEINDIIKYLLEQKDWAELLNPENCIPLPLAEKSEEIEERLKDETNPAIRLALSTFDEGLKLQLDGNLEEAVKKYEAAMCLDEDKDFILVCIGVSLFELAKIQSEPFLVESLLDDCIERCKEASAINPENDLAFALWGNVLHELSLLKKEKSIFEECIEKYNRVMELDILGSDVIYNNWGNALSELSLFYHDDLEVFTNTIDDAVGKFQKATSLNPEYAKAYCNWGVTLARKAELYKDENLFLESFEKYRIAVEKNPNTENLFYNWGNGLFRLAMMRKDTNLFKECAEKYQKATAKTSEREAIFYNWGTALLQWAKLENSKQLYTESIEKYRIVLQLNPEKEAVEINIRIAQNALSQLEINEIINTHKNNNDSF